MIARNEDIRGMLTRITIELRVLKKSLKNMPAGKLMLSLEHGKIICYRLITVNGVVVKRRINHNEQLVYKLGHKAYLEEKARRLAKNLKQIEMCDKNMMSTEPQDIIAALPRNFQKMDYSRILNPEAAVSGKSWPNPSRDLDIQPVEAPLYIDDMDVDEWAAIPYRENTKDLQKKTHRSNRGILCRSKGEASFLDLLDSMELRYHYDEVVIINGYRLSPDFIIMRSDGKIFYVEHRGWQGDDYDNHNMWKDNQYHNAGIVLGRNYLITFDRPDGSADTELIRRQLENLLLSD